MPARIVTFILLQGVAYCPARCGNGAISRYAAMHRRPTLEIALHTCVVSLREDASLDASEGVWNPARCAYGGPLVPCGHRVLQQRAGSLPLPILAGYEDDIEFFPKICGKSRATRRYDGIGIFHPLQERHLFSGL